MRYSDLLAIVGKAHVTITTDDLRYSELHQLTQRAAAQQSVVLTIVVAPGTITASEIALLAKAGGQYVHLDLTQV